MREFTVKCLILLIFFLYMEIKAAYGFSNITNNGVKCPIGFNYLNSTNLCYQIKRQEKIWEKYKRCSGNEVSLNFRQEYLDVFKDITINRFWTDYVRPYDGGPFINWRNEDIEMGKPVSITINSNDIHHQCAYMDISSGNVTSDFCNKTYARLCVIKPYGNSYPFYWDCPPGYTPYPAPIPTCLIVNNETISLRRVALRATWNQASEYCKKHYGDLPQRGYIYLNHEEYVFNNNREIPLGIVVENKKSKWLKPYRNKQEVDLYEQNFYNISIPDLLSGPVALSNGKWIINSNSSLYFNAVCEAFIELPDLTINFTQSDKKLFVNVSENIKAKDVWCFTDSFTYYPIKISLFPMLKNHDISQAYFLETIGNGYYWCLVSNTREYIPTESDKYLFVRNGYNLRNVYAIKIQFYRDVGFSDYFIKEYLKSFFTNYNMVFGSNKSDVLQSLENENGTLPQYILQNKPLLYDITVKALYLTEKSVLIHASYVNDFVRNYRFFPYFHFVYVRNVKYCETYGSVNEIEIGQETVMEGECKRYKCNGDFNEGAYWIVTDIDNCIPMPPINENPPTTVSITTTTTTVEINTTTTHYIETTVTTQPILDPSEEIDNVVNEIDNILSGPVNSSQLNTAINRISDLFESISEEHVPSSILQGIDRMLEKVNLPENKQDLKIVQPNLAVVVADKSRNSLVTGIHLKFDKQDLLNEDQLHLLTNDNEIDEDVENEIIVKIPSNLLNISQGRFLFTIFKDDKAFSQNLSRVNSKILSVSAFGMDIFKQNRYIDMHFRPQEVHNGNETKVCAYWHFKDDVKGKWSTDGCQLLPAAGPGGLDTCRCTHLTHFAQLIVGSKNNFGEINYNILTTISIVGCAMSLFGLFMIALTGSMFRSWRTDFSNKIWLNLSAAMSIMIFTFLLVAWGATQKNEMYCMVTGVLLHYSVLASFGWMLISAVLSYQRLVTVFTKSSSHKLLKACVCGWVSPFLPIGFLFVFDSNNYSEHILIDEFSNGFCYPSGLGLWLTVFLPVALIVIVNAILFFLIVYSVFINSKIKRHGDNRQLFRSISVSFLLFFLFGLTWIFGLFANHIVMAYLFCLTATCQGLILFLFFVIGNKKTRDLWLVQLKLKEKKKLPSTTSMSRSFPSRGNSKSGKIQSIKRSDDDLPAKPKSLSGINGKNDSRFS